MVVNRKQPGAPQAVSRSASTQNIPTKRQPLAKPAPRRNGGPEIDSRPSPAKPPTHTTKKRRPKTLLDRLFYLSLSLFALYAFYTCRPNPLFATSLHAHAIDPNPLCRSLHSYRVHILEPYILPPVRHTLALTHDLAEPYLAVAQEKAEPYVAPLVKGTQAVAPYVVRAVDGGKAVWTGTLVPFYKGTLKPYYVKAVLPRYRRYIHPRLAPLATRASRALAYYVSRPLHIQATRLHTALHRTYHTHAEPYVAQIRPYVVRAYTTAHHLTLRATDVYATHIHPRVVLAWTRARPFLCAAWKHAKATMLKIAEVTAAQLKHGARELGKYRRTFVDPHVRRIWDKVAEGTEGSAPLTPLADVLPDTKVETKEAVVEPTNVGATEQEEAPVRPTVEYFTADRSVPTPEEAAESVDPTPAPTSASSEPAAPTTTTSTSAVEEPSATDAPAPAPTQELDVIEPAPETTPTPAAPEHAMNAAASVEAASLLGASAGDDLDLDAFLQDIGVDEAKPTVVDVAAGSTQDTPPPPPTSSAPALTEAEKAAKIAAKRDRIVERHEKWFDQLDSLIANETQALVEGLAAWRAEKGAELAGLGIVQDVQKEGERLIKGLESYLKKTAAKQAQWKLPADSSTVSEEERNAKKAAAAAEKDKFATVQSKVEAKFAEKVAEVQAQVHAWFAGERERELDDVRASAITVKNFAERAQADLGLDYAWLEDVTYADWQSYHDLMRAFEIYEQTAHALQNGTALPDAPAPPADPILPALDALHRELQDVILGFSVALGPVRSEAAKLFSVHPPDAEEAEDEESGFFVVRDGQTRKDDLRGVDVGGLGIEKKAGAGVVKGGVEEKEEVKLLPIGGGEEASIFVGKDRVQVEQALGGVPLEPAAAKHEEL